MPIYEYHCDKCESDFEELVSGGEDVCCPYCRSSPVRRLMSTCAHRSGDSYVPASGGPGCSSCTSGSCSGCGH